MELLWNDGWQFACCPLDTPCPDAAAFTPVALPHDWLIANPNPDALYASGFGYYRKCYDFGDLTDRCIRLRFGAVYQDVTVYINGEPVFDWKYGYSTFTVNLTPHLHAGENEIVVLVRHQAPNTRWYSGAGIFRDVKLLDTPISHFVADGLYVHAEPVADGYDLRMQTEIAVPEGCMVAFALSDGSETIYEKRCDAAAVTAVTADIRNPKPHWIWDIAVPNLLTLTVQLWRNHELLDTQASRIGLRTLQFTPDQGFFLNGRHVKLYGVCLHHDLGCLGAAFAKDAARRQLQSMLDMGVNAIRTSHNMPDAQFLDLCDEMGLLVDDEAFDMWEKPKNTYDYARFFTEWFEQDVASWVRRDRNHPCIIMWSVGNEIYDTHGSPRGAEVAALLHQAVRKHDPLGNAPTTFGSNYLEWEPTQQAAEALDLVGYNYGERLYLPHHAAHPDWCIYGSETTAGVKSRGVYHFPASAIFLTHDDLQCSSLGNCRGGFGVQTAQKTIQLDLEHTESAGMFLWTGSDYLGEPSPYRTKNAYYGMIDTAGLRKDAYYLYQAAWTSKPVLHLFPYWDFNEGQMIDVIAYTNLEQVELFCNGESCGVRKPEAWTVQWQIPYRAGEICAVGTAADGTTLTAVRHSFGDSAALRLTADREHIPADGRSMVFVTVETVDADGYPVENARDRVTLTVTGGTLMGFDNGDSTDYDSFQNRSRKLFSGKAVAYIAAPLTAGECVIRAEAPGVQPAELVIPATPATVQSGIALPENPTASCNPTQVPIRNIQLQVLSGKTAFTPEQDMLTVSATICPQSATDTALQWQIVTASGIPSNLAELTVDGKTAMVHALGDGEFRIRCSAANGKQQPEVISELECTVSGMGMPTVDPFAYCYGASYQVCQGQVNEVIDGGIQIDRNHPTVGYRKLDFGRFGSDSVEVWLLSWFRDTPVQFSIWCGNPDSDIGVCLGTYTYEKAFIWQTYQSIECRFPMRLRGVQDIFFRFDFDDRRLDLGGFRFVPKRGAYLRNAATDLDNIHGDRFALTEDCIAHIGNNVFIDYDNLLLDEGVSALTLWGKTYHATDSVHVQIVPETGEPIPLLFEFTASDAPYAVRCALPQGVQGVCNLRIAFLPGSDFDLHAFQYER